MPQMTPALHAEIRRLIRAEVAWGDRHKWRVLRMLDKIPGTAEVIPCSGCLHSEHECLWSLIRHFNLEEMADEMHLASLLTTGERLCADETGLLSARGRAWAKRLDGEFHITVPDGYLFIAATPVLVSQMGYTSLGKRVIVLPASLVSAGLDVADMVLVHHLIHASRPPGAPHGPEFRRLLRSVYPWAEPGPVTEHDLGTPRRDLWDRAVAAVKEGGNT